MSDERNWLEEIRPYADHTWKFYDDAGRETNLSEHVRWLIAEVERLRIVEVGLRKSVAFQDGVTDFQEGTLAKLKEENARLRTENAVLENRLSACLEDHR